MKIKLWIVVLGGVVLAALTTLSIKVALDVHSDKIVAITERDGCLESMYYLNLYCDSIEGQFKHDLHLKDSILYERDRVLSILGKHNSRLRLHVVDLDLEIIILRDSLNRLAPPKPCYTNISQDYPVIK